MGLKVTLKNIAELDKSVESTIRAGRIPGAAIAAVVGRETVFSQGYGYSDFAAKSRMTSNTLYPIASTTKAFNATLLGMLVDEGLLEWDQPVQNYIPQFRLGDLSTSTKVTIRDLITMRTGLPRHDWSWNDQPISRAELVLRIRHLELSAGFRERFQYNNVTVATAGHVAEVVTGQRWEDLLQRRILTPVRMDKTEFSASKLRDCSASYHETSRRDLVLTQRLETDVNAPAGGSIHSSVDDMAKWVSFNLLRGTVDDRPLIMPQTLMEIHSPQIVVGADPSAPSVNATYAMGWFVDAYDGRVRISHGGYAHDVNSEVSFFPEEGVGIVSFTNFGGPRIAGLLNEQAFAALAGLRPRQSIEDKLAQYERKVRENCQRIASLRRIDGTAPSHPLSDYQGVYTHPGYGDLEIRCDNAELILRRNNIVLPMRHWHYDAWVAKESDMFSIHARHPFDGGSLFVFDTNEQGEVAGISSRLEPEVSPVRLKKRSEGT